MVRSLFSAHSYLSPSLQMPSVNFPNKELCIPLILKSTVVDVLGGEFTDLRVHAVLHAEEEDGRMLRV